MGREMREELIQADPGIMMGKPVIAGTRITVELVLEQLAAGKTIEQIFEAHPRLTREAIQAALAFAARVACGCYLPHQTDRTMNFPADDSVLAIGHWGCEKIAASVRGKRWSQDVRVWHT